ncbi:HD domain-containing protein [Komagataeibacter rhaeticus]|uniref:HD domain-containing protein n=1 Tax=Komagataeibacter rhaeticus TaxID=215221 RepID=UPI0004D87035|nr:HD domain-containing protein [Komagataeibacter rhaeticus]KDU95175.1 hypothetical protein GLUCORHAEAF1_09605 [Komagataeibacter rhaeticus AF1]
MDSLISRADKFATEAHAGVNQRRKYTGDPYIVHPRRVAQIVQEIGVRDEVIAAALLHDVVEDTSVTLEQIRREFNADIADLVEMVTNISCPGDGNRNERMAMERRHLAQASPEGQTIKLADLIDNTLSITQHDPDFARSYLKEMTELLKVLKKGDKKLKRQASDLIREYKNK